MKCHYINVRAVGRVLIPGCMAVAVSNDIERCTCCDILTEKDFEKQRYNDGGEAIETGNFRTPSRE